MNMFLYHDQFYIYAVTGDIFGIDEQGGRANKRIHFDI